MVILSRKPQSGGADHRLCLPPHVLQLPLGDHRGRLQPPAFLNNLIVSIGAVLLSLIVGIPAAYALARFKFKGKENIAFTFLSFRFAPEMFVILPLFIIYQRLG